jgi:hypothetical protein
VALALALLLPPFESFDEDTVDVIESAASVVVAFQVIVTVALSPGERNGAVQVTVCPAGDPQEIRLLVPTNVAVGDETVLLTTTFVAVAGPLLLTTMVKATALPAATLVGDALTETDTSPVAETIGTFAEPVALHEPPATVTPRVTLPLGPAVKEMAFVAWPAVIEPLPIVQLYVAPAVNGTEAPLLADEAVTDDGALTFADGAGETLTRCEVVALQPPLLTVTL